MSDRDGRTVARTLHIGAPPEVVWRYWTDPARMTKWWGPSAEQEGDTLLTLRHTGLPAAHADEHDGGWAHFLAILGERVEEAAR